jgi:hypothetical protein
MFIRIFWAETSNRSAMPRAEVIEAEIGRQRNIISFAMGRGGIFSHSPKGSSVAARNCIGGLAEPSAFRGFSTQTVEPFRALKTKLCGRRILRVTRRVSASARRRAFHAQFVGSGFSTPHFEQRIAPSRRLNRPTDPTSARPQIPEH